MPATARKTDPWTSHEAARNAEGTAHAQQAKCFEMVRLYPGSTSAEVAYHAGLDRYAAARRLPELRREGLVWNGSARICRIQGTKAIIWNPTSGPGRLF